MDGLFKIHSIIFHQNRSALSSKYWKVVKSCVYELIIFCQMAALIKEPSSDKSTSGSQGFWNIFSYFDVFTVSLNLGYAKELTVIITIAIGIQFFCIVISYSINYLKKSIPNYLQYFMKLNYVILCQVLMIPSLHLLFIAFILSEDLNNIKRDQVLEFGVTGKVIIFLFLLCEILLIVLYDCFSYTVRHRSDDCYNDSKIHPK